MAPIGLWADGNAIKAQDLWVRDTIRFPSPAPEVLLTQLALLISLP